MISDIIKRSLPVILFFIAIAARSQTKQNDEKQRLIFLLQASLDSFYSTISKVPDQFFFKQPNDSTWSLAQITEHLAQIEEGYDREYFVAINTPPPSSNVILKKVTDEEMTAYETAVEKTKARGTNLPRNRYCTKGNALKILQEVRSETIDVLKTTQFNLREIYTYRKKGGNTYEEKDMYQFFLLLIAHMKRHTRQAENVVQQLHLVHHSQMQKLLLSVAQLIDPTHSRAPGTYH